MRSRRNHDTVEIFGFSALARKLPDRCNGSGTHLSSKRRMRGVGHGRIKQTSLKGTPTIGSRRGDGAVRPRDRDMENVMSMTLSRQIFPAASKPLQISPVIGIAAVAVLLLVILSFVLPPVSANADAAQIASLLVGP